jgi:hypothetical protein
VQGMERISDGKPAASQSRHPIELLADAYGL